MHVTNISNTSRHLNANTESRETTESSGANTPTESVFSQDLPIVNVDPGDVDGETLEDSSADLLRAELANLNLSRSMTNGLETPSTARDLYNATPRVSLSPEPQVLDGQSHTAAVPVEDNEDQPDNDVVTSMRILSLENHPRPYDVGREALPSELFFDRDFQRCLDMPSAQTDSELSQLRATAEKLRRFESPAIRIVGIVGDSAAGKSSLVNSLLNIPDLAHKGDHGTAVTSFVTEYRRRSSRHTAPFTIEAEYCNQEEINDQLRELLVSYRELYQPGLDEELEGNARLFHEIKRKSEVALSTLQSIFPDHPEVMDTYLRDETSGAFERVLENLRRLAEDIQWPVGAADGKWAATATNSVECHDQVAYFMQKGLWPLTNIVRIYLSAQVLKSGVVLADLPGYTDINLARVRKAEHYLLRCQEVFIVARIDRVLSDQSVATFVENQMKASGKRVSVTIVCTHADDIDLVSAKKRYKSVLSSEDGKKALRAKRHLYEHGSPSASQLADLKYKYLYITARNADVKRAVKKRYANPDAGLTVNVFCVGNRDYEGTDNQNQEARDEAVHGSCIPDLRRFCHSIVARAQFTASLHFLEVELPSLIQSLKVWVSASQQKPRRTPNPRVASDLQSSIKREIEDFAEALEDAVFVHVLDIMAYHDRDFSENALEASREWIKWDQGSYKAFCRRNGKHDTAAIGSRSWNAELLEDMNTTMSTHWPALRKKLLALRNALQTSITNRCKATVGKFKVLDLPEGFLAAFRYKERELKYLLRNTCLNVLSEVQNIEFNATGDHMSSFILELMIPTYRACAMEMGTGTKVRMHEIMSTRLDKRDIFRLIHHRIEGKTQELFGENTNNMFGHVTEMCESVRRQLEAFNGPSAGTQRKKPEEVTKVRILTDTSRARLVRLQEDLETFEKGVNSN